MGHAGRPRGTPAIRALPDRTLAGGHPRPRAKHHLALEVARNLKFAQRLPQNLSVRTVAAHMGDSEAVDRCLHEAMVIV